MKTLILTAVISLLAGCAGMRGGMDTSGAGSTMATDAGPDYSSDRDGSHIWRN